MKNLIFHLISSISNNFTCSGPLGFSAFLIPFLCYYQRLKNLTFSPRKDGSLYYLVFIPRRVVHAFDYRKHIPNQKWNNEELGSQLYFEKLNNQHSFHWRRRWWWWWPFLWFLGSISYVSCMDFSSSSLVKSLTSVKVKRW